MHQTRGFPRNLLKKPNHQNVTERRNQKLFFEVGALFLLRFFIRIFLSVENFFKLRLIASSSPIFGLFSIYPIPKLHLLSSFGRCANPIQIRAKHFRYISKDFATESPKLVCLFRCNFAEII